MATDQERLVVTLEARMRQFEKELDRATGATTRTARTIEQRLGRTETFLRGFGSGAFKGLIGQLTAVLSAGTVFRAFIRNTIEAQNVTAQLNAALASTGGVAGLTADQLDEMAKRLQGVTAFEDDAIASAEALLLTFTKIRGDVFTDATETILDMSSALGQDLKSSAIQVGKALNDPVKGITALQRVGVGFSDAQKTIIKDLVKTGDLTKAQVMILKELQVEFGGSAVAARDTLGGALKSLANAWGDLFELSGPATDQLQDAIEQLISAITDTEFREAVQLIGVQLVNALERAARAAPLLADQFVKLRQRAEDFRADFQGVVQGILDVSDDIGRVTGLERVGEALGITDANTRKINDAFRAVKEMRREFELLDALQEKANKVGEIAGPKPGERQGNIVFIDPQQAEDEARALEEEAAAIQAAAEAAREAEAQRKRAAAEIQRQKEAVVELIADLEFENSLIGLSNVEREKEIALRRAGSVATEEQRAEIAALVAAGDQEREALDRLIDRMDALRDTAGGALSSFMDELREGGTLADGLSSALDRVLDSVLAIIQQQLINSLFGAPGTANPGVLGGSFPFGGARAQGGPVSPGKVYRIGERGPELFAPRMPGRVIPNGGTAGRTELHFHNAPPVVERTETRDSQGNSRQDIMFETAMVGATQNPRTRRAMGLSQPLVRR
jgi:hypothetical protein